MNRCMALEEFFQELGLARQSAVDETVGLKGVDQFVGCGIVRLVKIKLNQSLQVFLGENRAWAIKLLDDQLARLGTF